MSDEGITLELNTKQAVILSLSLGLVIGGFGGFAVGATKSQSLTGAQDTPSADNQASGSDSGSNLVSLDGVELEGEPNKGNDSAPIKVVEVNEFGCPFCSEWNGFDASSRIQIDSMDIADSLENQYVETGEVQLISKDYPVPQLHPNGPEAHKAANCVYENEQDSYWDFHDQLFDRRDQWMAGGQGDMEETFRQISNDLGLDTDTVMQCYENSENKEANNDKSELTRSVGRLGTPTFFIGNREKGFVKIEGAQPLPRFEEAIQTVRNS